MALLASFFLPSASLSNIYYYMRDCFPESHVGVSWKLKNEIPNSHILDQVSGCTYMHELVSTCEELHVYVYIHEQSRV